VELTIDRNGSVQKVRGMNGSPILLHAAEEAARQWKYAPFSADTTTLPAVTLVKFNFKLDSGTRQ
jgi:outer membrane biosynthesis protein TonB